MTAYPTGDEGYASAMCEPWRRATPPWHLLKPLTTTQVSSPWITTARRHGPPSQASLGRHASPIQLLCVRRDDHSPNLAKVWNITFKSLPESRAFGHGDVPSDHGAFRVCGSSDVLTSDTLFRGCQ